MIQIVPQLHILLAYEPVDFRKGFDSLVELCKNRLDQDPFSDALFVFRNRSGTALKLLVYDGQGFWLCLKRFSKGRLHWWPQPSDAPFVTLWHRKETDYRLYRVDFRLKMLELFSRDQVIYGEC
jgi:transposase